MHENPDNIITQSDKRILRIALSAPVLLVVALVAFQMFKQTTTYKRYFSPGLGGKPVIELTGVVTEYPSGKPIAGAFVLSHLYNVATEGFFVGGFTCVASPVAITDAHGRYHVRWSWEEHELRIPDQAFARISAYGHGLVLRPSPIQGKRSSSNSRDVQLARDDATFAQRAEWLDFLMRSDCEGRGAGFEWAELYRAIHAEYWHLYCDPIASKDVPLDFKTYERMESRFIDAHGTHWSKLGQSKPDDRIHDWWNERITEARRAAPTYPWAPDYIHETPPEPRDLTLDEKRQLCAAFDPAKLKWGTEP